MKCLQLLSVSFEYPIIFTIPLTGSTENFRPGWSRYISKGTATRRWGKKGDPSTLLRARHLDWTQEHPLCHAVVVVGNSTFPVGAPVHWKPTTCINHTGDKTWIIRSICLGPCCNRSPINIGFYDRCRIGKDRRV